MADGVFTPAVSVTSAVGGIAVAKPSVTHDVVPISIVGSTSYHFNILMFSTTSGISSGIIFSATVWDG